MRGQLDIIKSIVSDADLHSGLSEVLSSYFKKAIEIRRLDRRVSEYCSSFIIEELDVEVTDGLRIELIFKDLSRKALLEDAVHVKPLLFYNPLREIDTYRYVLAPESIGTPIFYGAFVDDSRQWLFIERLAPVLLWQMGDFEIWKDVSRWLARMHQQLASSSISRSYNQAHLIPYDRAFYLHWMERATVYVEQGDNTLDRAPTTQINLLATIYPAVVERLLSLPRTVIHGEFFASNVLLDINETRMRTCPVDWEMAGVGPGLVDLAGLTSGGWTQEQKDAMALAYFQAMDSHDTSMTLADFLLNLERCRLHQAIQWLGWSPGWTPPPEHAQNWLKEAMLSANRLGLLGEC